MAPFGCRPSHHRGQSVRLVVGIFLVVVIVGDADLGIGIDPKAAALEEGDDVCFAAFPLRRRPLFERHRRCLVQLFFRNL